MTTLYKFDPIDLPSAADANPERIKLWTDALRPGKYKRTRRVLSDGEGYCCLGVACEIAIEHGLDIGYQHEGHDDTVTGKCVRFGNESSHLPMEVADWYGLDSRNPWVTWNGHDYTLAALNDDGAFEFPELADLIDAKYCPQPELVDA